jgi:hypothetical protein
MTADTARAGNLRNAAPARARSRRNQADYIIGEYLFLSGQGVPLRRIAEQLGMKPGSLSMAITRYGRREG